MLAAAGRGGTPGDLPRLRGLRPLRQADRSRTGTRYDRHVELVGELLAGLDLSDAIVVVQDWGGPIGLTLGGRERGPGRRAGDPQHRPLHRPGVEGVHGLARLRREEPGPAGRLRDPGRRRPPNYPTMCVAGYEAPFPTAESKAGRRAVPAAGPDLRGRPRWPRSSARSPTPSNAGRSRRWSPSPTAIPVFPFPEGGRAVHRWIPTAGEQVKIEGAAHFLQEDRGEQIAGEILRFLG